MRSLRGHVGEVIYIHPIDESLTQHTSELSDISEEVLCYTRFDMPAYHTHTIMRG
jgi:hypothetical protein